MAEPQRSNDPQTYPPAGAVRHGNGSPGGDGEEVNVQRARQGVLLGRMRYVLLLSLLLVIVAFAIGYFAV